MRASFPVCVLISVLIGLPLSAKGASNFGVCPKDMVGLDDCELRLAIMDGNVLRINHFAHAFDINLNLIGYGNHKESYLAFATSFLQSTMTGPPPWSSMQRPAVESIKALLDNGADPNYPGVLTTVSPQLWRRTHPISDAIADNIPADISEELVTAFLSHGLNPNTIVGENSIPANPGVQIESHWQVSLLMASFYRCRKYGYENPKRLMTQIISKGGDPNWQDNWGHTLLMTVAFVPPPNDDCIKLAEELLVNASGSRVNEFDRQGFGAIDWAESYVASTSGWPSTEMTCNKQIEGANGLYARRDSARKQELQKALKKVGAKPGKQTTTVSGNASNFDFQCRPPLAMGLQM